MNSRPVEEDHRFADGQFFSYLPDCCQGGRCQPIEQVIGDGFPVPVATRDLAVGRLVDLGGFPNCLVPDSWVGVGEGLFGGMEPGGDRGSPPDRDGGALALAEVADEEDAVLDRGRPGGPGVSPTPVRLGPGRFGPWRK